MKMHFINCKCILVFVLLPSTLLFSQADRSVDSLESLLKVEKNDTSRANLLNQLSSAYFFNENFPKAEQLATEGLVLSQKKMFAEGQCKSYSALGSIYSYQGEYSKALDSYSRGLFIAKSNKLNFQICQISNRLAVNYQYMGNYERASECLFSALRIAEDLKDQNLILSINSNIGLVYYKLKDYPKALLYFRKSYSVAYPIKNYRTIAIILSNVGNLYCDMEEYDSAFYYLNKALAIYNSIDNSAGKIFVYNGMANLFSKQGKYRQSLGFLNKIVVFSNSDKKMFDGIYTSLGNCYLNLNQLDSAEYFLKLGCRAAEKSGRNENTIAAYEGLFHLYEKKNNYENALFYFKNSVSLKDSIVGADSKAKIENNRIIYENDQKEKARAFDEIKKETEHQAELRHQSFVVYSILAGFLLLLIFALFVFRSLRITRKQKGIIEEKQKEILDSIHYAKRIQQSLLPTEKYVQKNLDRLNKGGKQ